MTKNTHNKLPKCGIIGAGQLARAIYTYFAKENSLEWIFVRNAEKQKNFANINIISSLKEIPGLPELVIIAVNDRNIEQVAEDFACTFRNKLKGINVIHCSGILNSDILKSCADFGAITAKVHPYQTLFSADDNVLRNASWGIEAASEEPYFMKLVEKLGGRPHIIDKKQTVLYHASAVAASNFLNTVLAIAHDIALAAGIRAEEFQPEIIKRTIENNLGSKHDFPLTGPIARGDIMSVEKHLQELQSDEILYKSYCHLALATADMAYKSGILTKSKYDEICAFLEQKLQEMNS